MFNKVRVLQVFALAGWSGNLMTIPLVTLLIIVGLVDPSPRRRPARPATLQCGDPLGFQVLLDRQGFSPGEIDGKLGGNAQRALAVAQAAHKRSPTGNADCETWRAIGGTTSDPLTAPYVISEEDVKGPFEKTIPRDIEKQAGLEEMSYRSVLEKLAERYHAAPGLLLQMNPGAKLVAGETIKVPAVTPFNPGVKPEGDPLAGEIRVQVEKRESALRVMRADGSIVFYAPVSSGSIHDPLPVGEWKVLGVSWHPVFHYNPKLFWDAKANAEKAAIKPGPNNPVGVVWVGLNIEHYGIHGTPEPSRVGHTESHGCVRLTNWDAARLASLVKPGTAVLFR